MAKRKPRWWLARDEAGDGEGDYVYFVGPRCRIRKDGHGVWYSDDIPAFGSERAEFIEEHYPGLVIPPGTIIELEPPRRKDK